MESSVNGGGCDERRRNRRDVFGCLSGLLSNRCELIKAEAQEAVGCAIDIGISLAMLCVVAVTSWVALMAWVCFTLWPAVQTGSLLVVFAANLVLAVWLVRRTKRLSKNGALTLSCTRQELMLDAESLIYRSREGRE